MARKNRVSVYDGIYHVTARIAHRAMLLQSDEIKDLIMHWVVAVAEFSGIEVWAFAIMDNHLHLFLHVPPVPEKYWLNPSDEPDAYAFGMRPLECRVPLWSPNHAAPSLRDGDSPSPASPRPAIGFMLDDGEMLERLVSLYGEDYAEKIAERWDILRKGGNGGCVDREKEAYCRRMYNLSQYVKTLKERISMWYNAKYGHSGSLWEGRFYSGVVEKDHVVKAVVAAYIGYNPVKARIADSPEHWRWSSYACAVEGLGPYGSYCRGMYERMLGCSWDEAKATLESIYADKLPDSLSEKDIKSYYDDYGGRKATSRAEPGVYRASQVIRATMKLFTGAYIGRNYAFFDRVTSKLPKRFPHAGKRSIRRCLAFVWQLPERKAA